MKNNIRAKLSCFSVEQFKDSDGRVHGERVTLRAVYSEDKSSENYSFSQATPAATLDMHISNPAALGAFEQGKEYYLDFVEATLAGGVTSVPTGPQTGEPAQPQEQPEQAEPPQPVPSQTTETATATIPGIEPRPE